MAITLPNIGGKDIVPGKSIVYFFCFQIKTFVLTNIGGDHTPLPPPKCLPLSSFVLVNNMCYDGSSALSLILLAR